MRVVVGISGGVDSSTTAFLLKKQGYEVIGVTLGVWQEETEVSVKAIADAKEVCKKIGIEHVFIDVRDKFKNLVIDPFAEEYIKGRTPNPCNFCNRYIKFTCLLEVAEKLGADYIATGHYANVEKDTTTGRFFLQKADFVKKDQTYALYDLTQEQLSKIIMPLGKYSKEEVRRIAQEAGLVNSDKKDSQEICFVTAGNYGEYIKLHYGYTPKCGNFVDMKGSIIGKHKGIINYTVGQRKGLGLSLKAPMYVTKIDAIRNEVILGSKKELEVSELTCTNINWMKMELIESMNCMVKIRYNATPEPATVYVEQKTVRIVFNTPVRGVAPGQAAVFYLANDLIGGGIIK